MPPVVGTGLFLGEPLCPDEQCDGPILGSCPFCARSARGIYRLGSQLSEVKRTCRRAAWWSQFGTKRTLGRESRICSISRECAREFPSDSNRAHVRRPQPLDKPHQAT